MTSISASDELNSKLQPDQTSASDFGIEVPHNYTAAEVFIQDLASMINQSDVETILRAQKQMLQRFEKTNEMLINCNALSLNRLKQTNDDFKRHSKLLADMKKDLDYIFRKIRSIQQKVNRLYPNAYTVALTQSSNINEEIQMEYQCKTDIAHIATSFNTQNHLSETTSSTTVKYIQMEETNDNGKPIENELMKRICSVELTNDSSDCTSEDTA